MRNELLALVVMCSFSCASGNIEVENACSDRRFETVPANIPIPNETISIDTMYDFSDPIAKLSKFGKVTITLNEMDLFTDEQVDLTFIRRVEVGFVKGDGSIVPIATSRDLGGAKSMSFDLRDQSSDMQRAIQTGPFRLKISGTATSPPESFTPNFRVCVSLKAELSSTVGDIK